MLLPAAYHSCARFFQQVFAKSLEKKKSGPSKASPPNKTARGGKVRHHRFAHPMHYGQPGHVTQGGGCNCSPTSITTGQPQWQYMHTRRRRQK